jgi:uncharacterized protein (TIGR00251 family)
MDLEKYIKLENNIWTFRAKLTPWASKSEFFSVLENWVLKFRIKAPAENWKANKEFINFLSKYLKINKKNIEIVSGKTEQNKLIKIIFN